MSDDSTWSVYELRQYTLRPGRRDTLIELFDREFVESQEELGARIVGQFRDLDRPDRFVWIRAFRDMASRAGALAAFYGGPVWKEHGRAANATMVDSDDVLLLRPVPADAAGVAAFVPRDLTRPPAGDPGPPPESVVAVTLYHRRTPVDRAFVSSVINGAGPEGSGRPLAYLETEPAENTFPALPVRTGENVLAVITRYAREADDRAAAGRAAPEPAGLARPPEELRLAPTARSLLR